MKTTYSVEIDAPPARVFHFIEDSDRVMEWLPNIVENENTEVTPEKVGTKFRQVYVENGRRIEMQGVVTKFEKDRRLACAITGNRVDLNVDYQLVDLDGRTRLTQVTDIFFKGFFVRLIFKMAARFSSKASAQPLDERFAKLKQLAEASDDHDD